MELREQELGPDNPATLNSHNSMGILLSQMGRHAEAIALLQKTLKNFKAQLGLDHADTLMCMYNLAVTYYAAGKLDQALPLFEETMEEQRAQLGPDHPDTLRTMSQLAGAYDGAGRLDQALTLFEETIEKLKAKPGPDHPDMLAAMNNLASTYAAAGKLDQALTLFKQTLDKRKAKLGPDHPDTLATMNNLAALFWTMKQLDRSIPLFEEMHPILKRKLGEDHPNTLSTAGNLGVNYRDAGRLTEAIPLLEEAHRKGWKHASLAWVGRELVSAYIQAGKSAEATALITNELASARQRLNPDSPQMGNQLAVTGMQRLQLQAFTDAESILRECLAIRLKTEADAWTTFNTQSLLGASLLGQKNYAEAEPLLLSSYEGMKQREEKIPPQHKVRLTEALERLVQLYDAWGQQGKADEWRNKLPVTNSANPAETKKTESL